MSKQQELDGDALPARKGFPNIRALLLLNPIPFLPPFSLSPYPIPITSVENHPLKLVSPKYCLRSRKT